MDSLVHIKKFFEDVYNDTSMYYDYFETALSKELAITRPYFKKSEIEIKEFCIPKLEDKSIGNDTFHYLCNGCYETTLDNIYRVLNNGSFTVGICTEKKTEEFKEIVKFYNILKDKLMKKGFYASSIESNVSSKNRIYLLMYDHRKHNRNKK